MKAFHFTLEAVRTLRQRAEQKAMETYAQSLLQRQRALERLDLAQREIEQAFQDLREKMAVGCAASEVAQAGNFQQALARRRDECAAGLTTAERRVNAALQAMLTARQQREVVDKSFDKQKSRHAREVVRSEQKLLDELAGRRGNSVFAWNSTGVST